MIDRKGGNKRIQRHPVATRRDCALGVITFNRLQRTDHVARIVDMSIIGVGIESGDEIDPGFVWFKDPVGGHKFGVLMWTRQNGDQYRSGIKFVQLTRDEEQYIGEQMKQSQPRATLRDPLQIISAMIDSFKKDLAGSVD